MEIKAESSGLKATYVRVVEVFKESHERMVSFSDSLMWSGGLELSMVRILERV